MEQVLNLIGPGSFTLGVLVTFYRLYLSQKDWKRISRMSEDSTAERLARITAMRHHLATPIGHPGWQAAPMFVGFGVLVACAVLLPLLGA